jgi:alpha-beta hydrolase superfamily lysophospholipase
MANTNKPDTIVLIHGFWVTPRSWEHWIKRYESRGYKVIAPAYPGFDVEVESLNRDPSPIEIVTVPQIVEKLEKIVRSLDKPPILMGHSAGGVFVQVLLDHGYGAVGVAFNSRHRACWSRRSRAQVDVPFWRIRGKIDLTPDSGIRVHNAFTR